MSTIIKNRDEKRIQLKKPRKYNVIFHNDEYTPFDFVENVLMEIFHKTKDEASVIATAVHKQGSGVAGVYTYEIAETKLVQVNNVANICEHPLVVTMEPE